VNIVRDLVPSRQMDESSRMQRSRSFGGVADVYERARPSYPIDAVRWLSGVAPARVLDLGSGTGKLTADLVGLGHEVIAADPSAPMLRRLRDAVPEAYPMQSDAESIGLATASVDVVVAGQAFHWFDPGDALPEIARVLRPGGTLALVWNFRDESVPWVRKLSAVIGAEDWTGLVDPVTESDLFRELEHKRFRFWQPVDRDGLLGLVRSRSYVATLGEAERGDLLAQVGALYDHFGRGADGMLLPYVTECYRASVTGAANLMDRFRGPDDDGLLIDFR
jgi:SAM-dependent methyltransferase